MKYFFPAGVTVCAPPTGGASSSTSSSVSILLPLLVVVLLTTILLGESSDMRGNFERTYVYFVSSGAPYFSLKLMNNEKIIKIPQVDPPIKKNNSVLVSTSYKHYSRQRPSVIV